MTSKDRNTTLSPLKITIIYLIVAGLWIIFSDNLLESIITDPHTLSAFQTYKGLFYVIITSLGLFFLIKEHDRQVRLKESKLDDTLFELESEQELKSKLFERIPVMVSIYDPDLNEFEINKEFEKVTGYDEQDVEEGHLLKNLYPDHDTREEAVAFMNSPGVGWKEFTMQTKSGDTIPTSWTNVKLTDNTSVGIGIDMSEIKASQAKVRESQELLHKTFESLEEGVLLLDPEDWKITDCNKGIEKIFGYSQEELQGESTLKLHIDEEHFQHFNEMAKQPLADSQTFNTEFRMRRKDGTEFHTGNTVSLVKNEAGEVERIVSVVRDIDKQKTYQKELEKRQRRLLRSQEIGSIGDWEFDPATEEVTWSPMMFEIFDRDPDLGPPSFEDIQSAYFEDDNIRHAKKVEEALEHGKAYDIDLQLNTEPGNKKYIRAIGIPITNKEGSVTKLLGVVQDITERKKIELQLLKSKERIQTITNNVPGVVYRYILYADGTDKLTYISKGSKKIWGYTPEQIETNNELIWNNIHPEDATGIQQTIQKSAESMTEWKMEGRFIKPDGSIHWHRGLAIPHKDKKGNITWDAITMDITKQKENQKELERRNEFIEKTLNNIPIGVAVNLIDSGEITLMNKKFTEIYGWPREKLENFETFFEKVYPDNKYRKRVFDMVNSDIASENPDRMQWKGIRITTQEGEERIVNAKNIPLYDQGLMISTVVDVTEQHHLEKKLRESEEKYRHLFENNPEAMWIYNPENLKFVEVNQAAISHYGYSEEEFLSMTLEDIRPKKDVEALRKDVKEDFGKTSYSEEWVHLKKDGTEIDVEISASDVNYQGNTYRLVLVNDITERKRIQEKIIQSVIEGEDRERKRIAHELHDGLGQYLVAANMNLESVKSDITELGKKREGQFKTGLSFLKNALSETRSIAYNLMPKAIADFGLHTALENMFRDLQKSTDIEFEFSSNCKDLQLINKAEANIYRILQEIVSNAVQHAACEYISATLEKKDNQLEILVEDDGKGQELSPEHEEQGLGLRSIRTRVQSLNGTLDIYSEPGKGMKTSIIIPNIKKLAKERGD